MLLLLYQDKQKVNRKIWIKSKVAAHYDQVFFYISWEKKKNTSLVFDPEMLFF